MSNLSRASKNIIKWLALDFIKDAKFLTRILLVALLTLILIIVALNSFFYRNQLWLIFKHPPKDFSETITLNQNKTAFHEIIGEDLTFYAWSYEKPEHKKIIIFCPGVADNTFTSKGRLEYLQSTFKVNLFCADYPGYGKSKGKASEVSLNQYSKAVADFVLNNLKYDPQNIIPWGHSLGGYPAMKISSHLNPDTIILEGVFTSINAMAKVNHPILKNVIPFETINNNPMNLLELSKLSQAKHLIIHSEDDRTVPYFHALEIEKESNNSILLTTQDNHSISFETEPKHYTDFLSQHILTLK